MPKHLLIPPGDFIAQQSCRSYKNEGIFDGSNPDLYGNQNAWGIYSKQYGRIAKLEEATSWYPQEAINDHARLLASAPDLLAALVTIAYEPIGHSEASVEEIYNDIVAIARKAVAKARGE